MEYLARIHKALRRKEGRKEEGKDRGGRKGENVYERNLNGTR